MIRLLLADLRTNLASRLGPLITIIGVTITLGVGLSLSATSVFYGGKIAQSMGTTATIVLVGAIIASGLVISSVQRIAVELRGRDYAIWQLAGVLPATIGRLVIAQSLVVAMAGALVGAIIADLIVPSTIQALWREGLAKDGTIMRFGPGAALVDILAVTALVLISTIPAARRASRTPALAVLRESTPPMARMTLRRWIAVAVSLLAITALVLGMSGGRSELVGMGAMLPPVLVALAASVAPILYPRVLRLWTALLPARVSPAWYLGRHNARHKLSRSTAAITPMMVAVAIAGGPISDIATATNAILITRDSPPDYYTKDSSGNLALLLVLVGAPVAVATLGSAVVVFVTGRDRYRDNALLRAAGATNTTIVAASIAEALIHAATAFLLGLAGIALSASIIAALFMRETGGIPVMPYIPVAETAGIFAAGLALILVSTVGPTLLSLRADVPAMLAAE
ncbi:ABC transporter permease [Agreia bicolorata]|uniref:ABC3 transporter permease C-terminal domain-containing protein n=1 Tax=Agreia bicolorata TaxID=110935 RepID=A0ABR5CF81_9MICO|nr:ABC transporter permease [Agreia bicolorata]KJC64272.1 hypothetical protein TZ00_07290 [Agreia bicolorata]